MPVRVRSNKFCCCIPVRLGVLIIGLLGVACGGVIAVAGIIQYQRIGGDIKNKLAYAIQILVYGMYALISILGLIGALGKKRRLIQMFHAMLVIHVLFSIASGSFALYRFFLDAPDSVNSCVNGSKDDDVVAACKKGVELLKGVLVGLFVFVWIMEIWGCIIVKSYSNQLTDEESSKMYRT
ncbi:hypothetical protein BDZ89DRAFT_1157204 [Hymenopellis radicata]|nr:hypothetical protein BDZ89DRAFT_1157204 [Hymenopellis radicata]